MSLSLKQLVKSSPSAQRLLSIPLQIRRKYLVNKYRSAFDAMGRLARHAQHDIRISVPEFDGSFTLSPKSVLFQRLIIYGAYEPAVSSMFLEHVDPNRDVVDVGANVGFFTVGAARRLQKGRVLAIEPTASAFNRLVGNVRDNGIADRVVMEKVLIADAPGEGSVNVVDGREEYSSLGRLVHPSVATADAVKEEKASIVTLDFLVAKHQLAPSLIKVDVEGAEFKVLRGAVETLRRFRPYVMAECSDVMLAQQGSSSVEVRELLASLGYRIVNPEAPGTPLGKTINGDIFCVPID
jgi:FkbM family methyltransferase